MLVKVKQKWFDEYNHTTVWADAFLETTKICHIRSWVGVGWEISLDNDTTVILDDASVNVVIEASKPDEIQSELLSVTRKLLSTYEQRMQALEDEIKRLKSIH